MEGQSSHRFKSMICQDAEHKLKIAIKKYCYDKQSQGEARGLIKFEEGQ